MLIKLKTLHNNSSDIIVKLPTISDHDKLNNKLAEKYPGIQISDSVDLLPTISIANMKHCYTPTE